jgi:hypothetical protein
MAKRDPSTRKPTEGQRTDIPKDADGMNSRTKNFCLYYLASGGKRPKWAAGMAGFSGDLGKRSRSLLEQPVVIAFLEKYAPPVNKFKVTSDPKSIIRRLEEISSAEGMDKTVPLQLKAIELMMRNQGMLEGTSQDGKDRLHEILDCWKSGPVERGSEPCVECKKMCGPLDRFCSGCGTEIKREVAPAEKLAAAKKKVGKAEVIQ